ncbi:MAG: hypothetical protein JWN94_1559 [Betaproteobacteria bacterium]|nr:hypothetical protein [Betaproteobacteria bacterium]
MLVTFRCKAWNSIIMNRDVAVTLLKMAGHSGTVPSALLAGEIPPALASLEQGLAGAERVEQAKPPPPRNDKDADEPPPVGIRLRAFPLIQMLKAAADKHADVTWEEGASPI